MSMTRGGFPQAQRKLSVAVYDMPRIVGKRLESALHDAGHPVLFEGSMDEKTARPDADVWVTKWSYSLGDYGFLKAYHPRLGIVSATNGVEHINREALSEFSLRAENCPTFSTIPVAEHAISLAFRSIYGKSPLPPLSVTPLIFLEYSDEFAERAVAHLLMRARQMEWGVEHARSGAYRDAEGRRPSDPWHNAELSDMRIGIIGQERDAFALARILREGFNCILRGYDIPDSLAGYFGVKHDSYLNIIENSDAVFFCTGRFGPTPGPWSFDTRELGRDEIDYPLTGSRVAVLGTGAIGSTIARICKRGFGCDVRAFNRSKKPELSGVVDYVDPKAPIWEIIADSDVSFVSLPFNAGTSNLIDAEQMGKLTIGRKRILVNVTRDGIIDSDAVYDLLNQGRLLGYATDVVPKDGKLCKGEPLGPETKRFLDHKFVVPTPHIAECSMQALERMVGEVISKLNNFMM